MSLLILTFHALHIALDTDHQRFVLERGFYLAFVYQVILFHQELDKPFSNYRPFELSFHSQLVKVVAKSVF